MPPVLQKVTAFITRRTEHGPDLLLFRHPNAGIQLPAGTVESGEPADAAALREGQEETGLADLRLLAALGQQAERLPQNIRGVVRTTMLRAGPSAEAAALGYALRHGLAVRITAAVNGFSEVVYEEYDHALSGPGAVIMRFSGWLPTDALAPQTERYFYHLGSADTRRAWDVATPDDMGHTFHCYWTPLAADVGLIPFQARWLVDFYPALLDSLED